MITGTAVQEARARLYAAELALHDAHASHVDPWVKAANDKLHSAVVAYERACQEARSGVQYLTYSAIH